MFERLKNKVKNAKNTRDINIITKQAYEVCSQSELNEIEILIQERLERATKGWKK